MKRRWYVDYSEIQNIHLNLIFKPLDKGIDYLEHFNTHLEPLEV